MAETLYKKISELNNATLPLAGTEYVEVSATGVSGRAQWQGIFGAGWWAKLAPAFSLFKAPDSDHADNADTLGVGLDTPADLHDAAQLTGAVPLGAIPAELSGKFAGIPRIEKITSGSGNWTVPAGVTRIRVTCVGGGGGGGNGSGGAGEQTVGGGGGGGTDINLSLADTLNVTPGDLIAYSVGAGGSAGVAGGNTTFAGATTGAGGGAGVNGGLGASNGIGGTGPSPGFPGSVGGAIAFGGCGGNGGGAGGRGGVRSNSATNGTNGNIGGGGGGGGGVGSSGGSGGSGIIIIEY